MGKLFEKIPPAKSLIHGLRCIGYNFATALADIIDNSISANSSIISVLSDPYCEDPYMAVLDNGCGMNRDELLNAMTLGSDRDKKVDSDIELGRFGLGLKSASFSQCLVLIVATKKQDKINCMKYDLEKIEKNNKWILEELLDEEITELPEIDKLNKYSSGTLVIWKKFDKIEDSAKSFIDSFNNMIANAKKHIEFVFHRFNSSILFNFNGKEIEKRDPFLECSTRTQKGRYREIILDGEKIGVTPFVLPYAKSLDNDEKKLLGNPKSIYDDQGFYIYRNKRLIISGSWLRMNVRSEFNKLARVRVDIPSSLDSVWMLDVKKSTAKIPDKIKEQLQASINDSIIRSKREIRYPGKKEQEVIRPIWYRLSLHDGMVKYIINREDNPLYLAMKQMFSKEEFKIINAYLDKVEEYIPKGMIVTDNADSIKIMNSEDLEENKLVDELVLLLKMTVGNESKNKLENMLEIFLNNQSYELIKSRKQEILEKVMNDEEH